MKELTICFKACHKEEDLAHCLKEAIEREAPNGYLSFGDFENYGKLLIENLQAGSYDGVALFLELWNTYEKELHVIASCLIPVYMKYLNAEQEMVLFAAMITIQDKDVLTPIACKISESYQPDLKQWPLFLKKLSLSDTDNIRYIYAITNSLLKATEKIKPEKEEKPVAGILNREVNFNKEIGETPFKN